MKLLSNEKLRPLAERHGWSIARAQGYVDGETCRGRGEAPSTYAIVGIDDYCDGFRAGYFVRRSPDLMRSENHYKELSLGQSRKADSQVLPPAA